MATQFPITEVQSAAAPTLDQLPFTARRVDGGIDLWRPAPVGGGWDAENRTGRELAQQAISYIGATNDCAMLPGIVRTIVEHGAFGGVEVGFFAGLSMRLAASAR